MKYLIGSDAFKHAIKYHDYKCTPSGLTRLARCSVRIALYSTSLETGIRNLCNRVAIISLVVGMNTLCWNIIKCSSYTERIVVGRKWTKVRLKCRSYSKLSIGPYKRIQSENKYKQ